MNDLFNTAKKGDAASKAYTAKDIEVLEGLEPVRRRPGMYIGGSDENAMHHLVSEVFDNAMDEAVAGHATRIELDLHPDNVVIITDNGRGIPIDPHPKFPKKSALEVILTTLHSGGKFSNKAYETSGGLHGVGISVVNALSDAMQVEVVRERTVYRQQYAQGHPQGKLEKAGNAPNRRGTSITFHPDPEIFGKKAKFHPDRLYKFARSKAYLFQGVEIRWSCDPSLLEPGSSTPQSEVIHFPDGLKDFLVQLLEGRETVTAEPFAGEGELAEKMGRVGWAIAWPKDQEPGARSYCNTVYTPEGGTHEAGLKAAITKSVKAYGEMVKNKKASSITNEDILGGAVVILSVFLKNPQFQGQTKDKLVSPEAARLVENAIKDHFDHWLSGDPANANKLLDYIVWRAEERARRRADREVSRKAFTQKLRLPGKLADCTRNMPKGTEIFLVEGDSAGGSAKQARDRETQAVLPLRGKILNVASATVDKIRANQEISDMMLALGCGVGSQYNDEQLRYEKVIIMTDADVDGAHIASLLMTFFYQEMPGLIKNGHLYLAQPPLYRVTFGTENYYPADDAAKEKLVAELSAKRGKIEIGRFKGLGEMTAPQLKSTTMNPGTRTLLRVMIADDQIEPTRERVEQLMGKKPELRFAFIQEQTALYGERIREALDV